MARWEAKKNATESDVRRMSIRGRNGTLKIVVLPLEDALARAHPKTTLPKQKSLSPRPVVVPPDQVPRKLTWKQKLAAARAKSQSAKAKQIPPTKETPQQERQKPATAANSPKGKNKPNNESEKKAAKRKPIKRRRLIYEGQPRYEGGVRIVQGGRFEQGRRR